jgi:hypothetical protein
VKLITLKVSINHDDIAKSDYSNKAMHLGQNKLNEILYQNTPVDNLYMGYEFLQYKKLEEEYLL